MEFLYQKLDVLREYGSGAELPACIPENLNPQFELRPYQLAAFENFITYFENKKMCKRPTQTLFHMATGSGKTLIMAGLMLYLYQMGYRNFLFFVNLSNIVKQTKDNFLNPASGKYLFAKELRIGGEVVPIREVRNFQAADENAVNICFTTTQALHSDLWLTKENAVSFDDFAGKKIVLISDEAHHLNVDTKKLKAGSEEDRLYHSWEQTVRRIFEAGRDNVLLEFTATCDLNNPQILAEYRDKIVYDYPLAKFRADGFSKEIKTLRTDVSVMERALQAIVLSQYRLKIFQDHRLQIKPVVLFKSAKIADSAAFQAAFQQTVAALTGPELRRISELTDNGTLHEAYAYFEKSGITFDQLAQELRDDFSAGHCISANDDREAESRQLALNSLESANNPYRAVFEVKRLDEGWDVLNLFDIVRLYETRQSSGKKISPATISEAQLIGRGARYCPFRVEAEQEKYKRKYDGDLEHPLRICEELYYHCQNDSRYIAELNSALKEIGVDLQNVVTRQYRLKDAFRADPLYTDGLVFVNSRAETCGAEQDALAAIRARSFAVRLATGSSAEDTIFAGEGMSAEHTAPAFTCRKTLRELAEGYYAAVYKALCRQPALRFDRLRRHFPALRSAREFLTSEFYLGGVQIELTSAYQSPPPGVWYTACLSALGRIADTVGALQPEYTGETAFRPLYIHDVFRDKKCSYTLQAEGGAGYSQNDGSVAPEWRMDLSREDWFAFEDQFGTGEEKAFAAYFKTFVPTLREKYDTVWLIRNERQLHLYAFDGGERFEPDYVLILRRRTADGDEQIQVFLEPKGSHLIENDRWKEDFLLRLEREAVPIRTFADGCTYKLCGFHFFNRDERAREFADDMNTLL